MYNNVDFSSETYEDIATEKLQMCQFQPLPPVWQQFSKKALEYLQIINVAKN